MGELAITIDAVLEGSRWAATNSSPKKAPMFIVPSTADRHHHVPVGRRRLTARRTRPAGSARSVAPQSGAPVGRNVWVT